MEKSEYLELYKRWTAADSHAETAELAKEILDRAFDELKAVEKVYSDCEMAWESPCSRHADRIYIDDVVKTRLISMNSAEVTISLCCQYSKKWQDVVLNVKHFGEKGRAELKRTLIEAALGECDVNISEAEDELKYANEKLAENTEKKQKLEQMLSELDKKED